MELNKIYLGDCLELMQGIEDKSIDMILTSPPYADLRSESNIQLDNYKKWFKNITQEKYRVLKESGFYVLNIGNIYRKKSYQTYHLEVMFDCINMGYNLIDIMIWVKPNGIKPKTPIGLLNSYEFLFVFSKSKEFDINDIKEPYSENTIKRVRGLSSNGFVELYNGERYQTLNKGGKTPYNVLPIGVGHNRGVNIHTSTFPERLPLFFINKLTNENDTILDPFIGSGTTAIACINTNRNFIGMEKEQKYFDLANERIRNHQAQLKLL